MNKTHPGHPDDETIAEFLDGRLAPERHAEILAHLDACPSCFELLAELGAYRAESAVEDSSGKLLTFPPAAQQPRARSARVLRAVVVAASLAVVAGVLGWFGRGADPGSTGPLVASLAADPAALADLRLVVVEGGAAGFSSRSREARAVLAGAALVDLAVLDRNRDSHPEGPDTADLCATLSALVPGACEHGRELATLERQVQADLPATLVEFGAWVELVRLAAATHDREVLARQEPPVSLQDPTLLAAEAAPELRALGAAWERARTPAATELDHAALAAAAKDLLVVL